MMKKIAAFVLSFFTFLILIHPPFASAKEFTSFYKTTYVFDRNGDAAVTQEVTLVNQSPDLYVSEYTLSVVGGQISQIEAFDRIGAMRVKTQVKDKDTIITAAFNEKVVGKGKTLSFILKYHSQDLATKEGNLWQVAIPKLLKSEEIDDYQLILKIPTEFGKIAFVNPNPREQIVTEGVYRLQFQKSDLVNYGVLVTLGQYQTFDFQISYELQNSGTSSRTEKITIPPDTNYQTVHYQKLQPEPQDVEIDPDGNWLAVYRLSPRQKLSILAEGQVNIFSQPKNKRLSGLLTSQEEYLAAGRYWPVGNSEIKSLADELKTPENIYRFVVNHLTYDYDQIEQTRERKDGQSVLADPTHSICTDFTDLFLTLARAAGIPARELDGFAWTDNPKLKELSENNDVLHSWPEYFDSKRQEWIMVDPTYENTSGGLDYFNKFDMSHFVFVIHGKDASLPLSPGNYKIEESQKKQILVKFGQEKTAVSPKMLSVEKVSPKSILSLITTKVEAELSNQSGFSLYNEEVSLAGPLKAEPREWFFKVIPPFSRFKINFSLTPKEQMKDYSSELIFKLDGDETSLDVRISSLLLRVVVVGGGLFALILIFLLFSLRPKPCGPEGKNANLKELP